MVKVRADGFEGAAARTDSQHIASYSESIACAFKGNFIMRFSKRVRCPLPAAVALAMLAGCSGGAGALPITADPNAEHSLINAQRSLFNKVRLSEPANGSFKSLYSFSGSPDGKNPEAALIHVRGLLYGTTVVGGVNNLGSVFQVTASGTESVLYSFKGGSDGSLPIASLVDIKGTLFGSTFQGGSSTLEPFSRSLRLAWKAYFIASKVAWMVRGRKGPSSTSTERSMAPLRVVALAATERSSSLLCQVRKAYFTAFRVRTAQLPMLV